MSGADDPLGPGPRTKIRRLAERGRYDEETVYAILDEGLVCHLGISTPAGPLVVPTAYVRVGRSVYLHGAPASASLGTAVGGGSVCLVVTLVDGLVMARSAFHHSINYRSVVVIGAATEVTDLDQKRAALEALVEHIVPGRGEDARAPTDAELRSTKVVRIEIAEASAKIRAGGPNDDPDDLDLPIWAGQLPFSVVTGSPLADEHVPVGTAVPTYLTSYARPSSAAAGERGPGP